MAWIKTANLSLIAALTFSLPSYATDNQEAKITSVQQQPSIIFVHGAWGGGHAFKQVGKQLQQQGYDVYRPSLTGLGDRVHLANKEIGLEQHIKDIVNIITFEQLDNVIIIGHSYGGMVISGVIDKVSDKIKHAIYLDAHIPHNGESLIKLAGERSSQWLEKMAQDGFLIPPWVGKEDKLPHDVPQPLKTFTDSVNYQTDWQTQLNASYILTVELGKSADKDTFYPSYKRADKYGWNTYTLAAGHNPQVNKPDELYSLIMKILDKT